MSNETELASWWRDTPRGQAVRLIFIKLDRAGSAQEWSSLSEDEVRRRRARYQDAVEGVARASGAALPLYFQGDGAMLFLDGRSDDGPSRAFRAAKELRERIGIELGLPLRIAVHLGEVPWEPETGRLAHPAIDLCGHLEHATPVNSIAVTEDLYLELPEKERRQLGPLGATVRDATPAFAFPAADARRGGETFTDLKELQLWEAFRAYSNGPDIRRLRYVGLPLRRAKPLSLDVRDVFTPLDVQVRRAPSERFGERDGRSRTGEPERGAVPWARYDPGFVTTRESLAKLFAGERSLVLLGDPGAGKTTLVRWLAMVAAGGRPATRRALGRGERLLPLPVSVGRLAETYSAMGRTASVPDALAVYFHERNVARKDEALPFLCSCLEQGSCLVLLDGLDEVRRSEREAIRGWLESFADRYPANRFVATARLVGYSGLALPGAVEAVVSPFDDQQVSAYVRAFVRAYHLWEGRADPGLRSEDAEELLKAIGANDRLDSLARNPFLLSALALIRRVEGRLPRHRVKVLEVFARSLCETWGSARRLVAGPIEPAMSYEEEALPVLGELAVRMHDRWPAGVAPEEFVVDTLASCLSRQGSLDHTGARDAARRFLAVAGEETQVLYERGPGYWSFLHLTFQEFFAAAGLHADERFEETALGNLFEPRFWEVVRLGVAYQAFVQVRPTAARHFLERVLEHREPGPRAWLTDVLHKEIPLAVVFGGEIADSLSPQMREELAAHLLEWYSANLSSWPGALDPVLDGLGRGGLGDELRRLAVAQWKGTWPQAGPFERGALCRATGLLGLEQARHQLEAAVEDPVAFVRGNAATALNMLAPDLAMPLVVRLLEDDDNDVALMAETALTDLGAGAVEPLVAALRRGVWRAASALGELKAGEAVPDLLECLGKPNVGWQAARALGRFESAAVLEALLTKATSRDERVREDASDALGHLGNAAAIGPLVTLLDDTSLPVRASAAEALGRLKAAGVLPRLESLAEGEGMAEASGSEEDTDQDVEPWPGDHPGEAEERHPDVGEPTTDSVTTPQMSAGFMELLPSDGRFVASRYSEEDRLRWAAAVSAAALGGSAGASVLAQLIRSGWLEVYFIPIDLMRRMPEEVVAAIRQVLEGGCGSRPRVRSEAAWLLGMSASPSKIDLLIQALSDPDEAVILKSAQALWLLSSSSAGEALAGLWSRSLSPEVRRAAWRALWGISETPQVTGAPST